MAAQILQKARQYLGVIQGSQRHQALVAAYRRVKPWPRGYGVKVTDDWCDIFVTVLFDQCHLSHLIGRECGVERHVQLMKQKGIWCGRTRAQAGDIIVFDWQANGWADHIGLVEKVQGPQIQTIEGNSQRQVRRKLYAGSDWRIKGLARPAYRLAETQTSAAQGPLKAYGEIAQEVQNGEWGQGEERIQRLQAAGYKPRQIQALVNQAIWGLPKKIKVHNDAQRWQTGQAIAPWVKGQTYPVASVKKVNGQFAYLLHAQNVPVGWLWAKDGQILVD